ncbi:Fc.00g043550.m01.CDS01 [Cosmosporella sp. VM-42]
MSSVSFPDWEIPKEKKFDWSIFDAYLPPVKLAIFVDDNLDNDISAQSEGFEEAISFYDTECLKRKLPNALGNPAQRGRDWLKSCAKSLHSESDTGIDISDNFSQLLIYRL